MKQIANYLILTIGLLILFYINIFQRFQDSKLSDAEFFLKHWKEIISGILLIIIFFIGQITNNLLNKHSKR